MIETARKVTGHTIPTLEGTRRAGDLPVLVADSSKIKHELGWQPTLDFKTGLEQTIDWYVNNEGWTQRVQDGSYRGERLGLGNAALNTAEQ